MIILSGSGKWQKRILYTLQTGPCTTAQLHIRCGTLNRGDEVGVQTALKGLVKNGIVRRIHRGFYTLVKES